MMSRFSFGFSWDVPESVNPIELSPEIVKVYRKVWIDTFGIDRSVAFSSAVKECETIERKYAFLQNRGISHHDWIVCFVQMVEAGDFSKVWKVPNLRQSLEIGFGTFFPDEAELSRYVVDAVLAELAHESFEIRYSFEQRRWFVLLSVSEVWTSDAVQSWESFLAEAGQMMGSSELRRRFALWFKKVPPSAFGWLPLSKACLDLHFARDLPLRSISTAVAGNPHLPEPVLKWLLSLAAGEKSTDALRVWGDLWKDEYVARALSDPLEGVIAEGGDEWKVLFSNPPWLKMILQNGPVELCNRIGTQIGKESGKDIGYWLNASGKMGQKCKSSTSFDEGLILAVFERGDEDREFVLDLLRGVPRELGCGAARFLGEDGAQKLQKLLIADEEVSEMDVERSVEAFVTELEESLPARDFVILFDWLGKRKKKTDVQLSALPWSQLAELPLDAIKKRIVELSPRLRLARMLVIWRKNGTVNLEEADLIEWSKAVAAAKKDCVNIVDSWNDLVEMARERQGLLTRWEQCLASSSEQCMMLVADELRSREFPIASVSMVESVDVKPDEPVHLDTSEPHDGEDSGLSHDNIGEVEEPASVNELSDPQSNRSEIEFSNPVGLAEDREDRDDSVVTDSQKWTEDSGKISTVRPLEPPREKSIRSRYPTPWVDRKGQPRTERDDDAVSPDPGPIETPAPTVDFGRSDESTVDDCPQPDRRRRFLPGWMWSLVLVIGLLLYAAKEVHYSRRESVESQKKRTTKPDSERSKLARASDTNGNRDPEEQSEVGAPIPQPTDVVTVAPDDGIERSAAWTKEVAYFTAIMMEEPDENDPKNWFLKVDNAFAHLKKINDELLDGNASSLLPPLNELNKTLHAKQSQRGRRVWQDRVREFNASLTKNTPATRKRWDSKDYENDYNEFLRWVQADEENDGALLPDLNELRRKLEATESELAKAVEAVDKMIREGNVPTETIKLLANPEKQRGYYLLKDKHEEIRKAIVAESAKYTDIDKADKESIPEGWAQIEVSLEGEQANEQTKADWEAWSPVRARMERFWHIKKLLRSGAYIEALEGYDKWKKEDWVKDEWWKSLRENVEKELKDCVGEDLFNKGKPYDDTEQNLWMDESVPKEWNRDTILGQVQNSLGGNDKLKGITIGSDGIKIDSIKGPGPFGAKTQCAILHAERVLLPKAPPRGIVSKELIEALGIKKT
jgi:hypothetical protein